MNWIMEHYQDIINIVVSVFVTARLVVLITPTPKDDAWLAMLIDWAKKLGLHIDKK